MAALGHHGTSHRDTGDAMAVPEPDRQNNFLVFSSSGDHDHQSLSCPRTPWQGMMGLTLLPSFVIISPQSDF